MANAPTDNLAFRERLQTCVVRTGGKPNNLAKASGIPLNTLLRYFNGSEPSREKLVQIADAAKVPVGWLAAGDLVGVDKSLGDSVPSTVAEKQRYGDGYVQAPWIMGSIRDTKGNRIIQYADKSAWLPFEFISDGVKGGNPKQLAAFRMKGNEMEPDILDGEIVMVDTSERNPGEGMKAVRIKNEITIRDVIQLSMDTYTFRHMQTPPSHEGIRFTADQLGLDVDILGRIIVVMRYPFRRAHRAHA